MLNDFTKLMLLVIVISGCSTIPKVHLFAINLEAESVTLIKKKFEKQNFELKINQQPFPDNIGSNSIVYTPSRNANQQIINIINTAAEAGYQISSTNLIMQSNHSFTANNIGLYLLPENYTQQKREYKIPLINEYGSRDCFNSSNLTLNEDKSFMLTVNRWDAVSQDYIESFFRGQWFQSEVDIIELIHSAWIDNLLFLRTENEINSNDGRRRVVSLIPQTSTENEKLKAINCTYNISLVI